MCLLFVLWKCIKATSIKKIIQSVTAGSLESDRCREGYHFVMPCFCHVFVVDAAQKMEHIWQCLGENRSATVNERHK